MTDLINTGQTMTSMQIAEVTGKQHCDVLRAIRNMESAWEKITASKFTLRYKINELANGVKKETPYYELTKTECLYIATKFNDEARARLILRWEQLENERLTATKEPKEAKVLPPPVDNQAITQNLIEFADGKPVTTSRKVAGILGRAHSSVLDTVKNNISNPAFKRGNLSRRDYASAGSGHGYEFLLTRRALDGLAELMRYGARQKLADAYKGAWEGAAVCLPVQKTLPLQEAVVPVTPARCADGDTEETVRRLEGRLEELQSLLEKARETLEIYGEFYRNEKKRRIRNGDMVGHLHDLYSDLMWRMAYGKGTVEERIEAHNAFKKRISGRI